MTTNQLVAMTPQQIFNCLSMVLKIQIRGSSEGELLHLARNQFHTETLGDHTLLAQTQDLINAEFAHISSTGNFSAPAKE